jgi:tRNA(His) guanylyltransferase
MSALKNTDEFGTRMKAYEAVETARRLDVTLPIYARIDGRSFSRFTRGMKRPFDPSMTDAMVETTKHLVEKTHARIGYTQSDEISLVWQAEEGSDVFFSGKVQKMVSVLASMAAARFITLIPEQYVERFPHFDCRVFQLPSRMEAANAFLWRAMDARKNAISMVAQHHFSHKALFGKDQRAMLAMLADASVDFGVYPQWFRLGTFVRRVTEMRVLTQDELDRIPEKHRPTGLVERSRVITVDVPLFNQVANREGFIFEGENPIGLSPPESTNGRSA